MGKQTFQGLIRMTNGRALSGYDKSLGRIAPILLANPVSILQIDITAGSGTNENIGLFPANVRVLGAEIISAGTSGTFNLSFPAYDGDAAVAFFGAAQNINAIAALTLTAADGFAPTKDRPLYLTRTTIVGTARLGIWCVGVDNARSGSLA